jgi:hypothetical protein
MTEQAQENIKNLSGGNLERLVRCEPQRVELVVNSNTKSDVWKKFRLVRIDGILVANQCACMRCKKVFSTSKNAGTSHLQRHTNSKQCSGNSTGTQLTLEQTARVKAKLSPVDIEAIKESELAICSLGYQSFHSLESEGLRQFAQTFVDLGAKRGRFDVSIKEGTMIGRRAIQRHCLAKAAKVQQVCVFVIMFNDSLLTY